MFRAVAQLTALLDNLHDPRQLDHPRDAAVEV